MPLFGRLEAEMGCKYMAGEPCEHPDVDCNDCWVKREYDRATGDERPLCNGCGCEIDPDVCGCGDMKDGHNDYDAGHAFVPAGCTCFYSS